jgi:hypothetical protein
LRISKVIYTSGKIPLQANWTTLHKKRLSMRRERKDLEVYQPVDNVSLFRGGADGMPMPLLSAQKRLIKRLQTSFQRCAARRRCLMMQLLI